MGRDVLLQIDTHALVRRVQALGLKQSWLADQLGVHRKTVSRWLKGRVQRIEQTNAVRLAELLECTVDELLAAPALQPLATAADQARAARIVNERELVELLSPTGDWELAERILRATLHPDLPDAETGRLTNLLSLVLWRQDRLGEAEALALRAGRIGERTGDRAVQAKALAHLGVIRWFSEDRRAATEAMERALAIDVFDTPRDRASVVHNLGLLAREQGRPDDALALQHQAIRCYTSLGATFNLAVAWIGVTLTELDRGDIDAADEARRAAHHDAARCNHAQGVAEADLLGAEIGRGPLPEGWRATCRANRGFWAHAVRTALASGEPHTAWDALREGQSAVRSRSLHAALLLREEARLVHADDPVAAAAKWEASNRILSGLELPGQVRPMATDRRP